MAQKGVNKVILIGNLGNDPEVRFMPNGNGVANISLATSETWKDKNTGEPQERTEWHRVVFFGKLAEIVGNYLKKGSKVYVEGKLKTRKWTGQDGQDRYTTEVVVDFDGTMQMLDTRGSGGTANFAASGASNNMSQGDGMNKNMNQSSGGQPQQEAPPMDSFDDDIPF